MSNGVSVDGTPTDGLNPYIDSLIWGSAWADPGLGTTIRVYFQSGADPYGFLVGNGSAWSSTEIQKMNSAFAAFEAVADIDFKVTPDQSAADVWYWGVSDTVMTNTVGPDIAGYHEVPNYSSEPLYGLFNKNQAGWTTGPAIGGYAYSVLIHELGHGLGLAHPHDGGTEIDASVFPGVVDPYDLGTNELNQGIWSVMSYNDGWNGAASTSTNYGFTATPMAFDIYALQLLYGANMTYNVGDNTYVLPGVNGLGTSWSCIWDAGGIDTISNVGRNTSATIDLRAAPLEGANAGGYVSHGTGIVGGFTIANGAVIENATGGNKSDILIGNAYDNVLIGNGGKDVIDGQEGSDVITGGGGQDQMMGGSDADTFVFRVGKDTSNLLTTADVISDFQTGVDKIDLQLLDASSALAGNNAFVWVGTGAFTNSASGEIRFAHTTDNRTIIYLDTDRDIQSERVIVLTGLIDLVESDFIL